MSEQERLRDGEKPRDDTKREIAICLSYLRWVLLILDVSLMYLYAGLVNDVRGLSIIITVFYSYTFIRSSIFVYY